MLCEIPTVARCCFCAPLRYGLLVWAYLKLISSIISLCFSLILLVMLMIYSRDFNVILILLTLATVLVLALDVVFNFVLIMGSHKKNTSQLQLYYRYAFAYPVIFAVLGLLWIFFEIDFQQSENSTIIAVLITIIGPLILHTYLFIVLRSEIFKIRAKYQFDIKNLEPSKHTGDDNGETAAEHLDI